MSDANKDLIQEMACRSTASNEQCRVAILVLQGLFQETWRNRETLLWTSLATFRITGCQVNHAVKPYVSYRLHAKWSEQLRDVVRGNLDSVNDSVPGEAVRRLKARLKLNTLKEARAPFVILKKIIVEAVKGERQPLCIWGIGTFRQCEMTTHHKQMFGVTLYGGPRTHKRPHFKAVSAYRTTSPSRKKEEAPAAPATLADSILKMRRIG